MSRSRTRPAISGRRPHLVLEHGVSAGSPGPLFDTRLVAQNARTRGGDRDHGTRRRIWATADLDVYALNW